MKRGAHNTTKRGDKVMLAPPIIFHPDAVAHMGIHEDYFAAPLAKFSYKIIQHLYKCKALNVAAVVAVDKKQMSVWFAQNDAGKFPDSHIVFSDLNIRVAFSELMVKPTGNHTVYRHYPISESNPEGSISHWVHPNTDLKRDGRKSYVGVTGRGWRARFMEHLRSADTGSELLFHRAMRDGMLGFDGTGIGMFDILALGRQKDEAYALEAKYIAELSLYPMGYNMIPGGKAGHQLIDRFLSGTTTTENREQRLVELIASPDSPFRYLTDDEYADMMTRVVCNNPNNFSVAELRKINLLAAIGWGDNDIADRLGVSERRIAQVVSGRTYKMVRL